MPLRRESWFFTHLVSGPLFSIVPNLIVGLLLMPQLNHYWFVSFIWVGGLSLSYLFFFGAATLSAMCTGSRFSMALVYGLINFLSLLICGLLKFLFEPLLFGIVIEPDGFIWFSPVSYLCSTELNYLNSLDKIYAHFNPNSGWPYLTLIAGVGIAMLPEACIPAREDIRCIPVSNRHQALYMCILYDKWLEPPIWAFVEKLVKSIRALQLQG
jgi:hypothetical protein